MIKASLKCLFLAGSITLLAACGESDTSDQNAVNNQAVSAESQATPEKNIDIADYSGRWSTQMGAIAENRKLVIDLASGGNVSIDVRAMEEGEEVIVEGSVGKAVAQGSVIKGTTEEGEGVHANLKRYKTWSLDPAKNQITGTEGKSLAIKKE